MPAPPPSPPPALGWAVRRLRELADRLGPSSPAPPRRLRARVGAPGRAEFATGGPQAAAELMAGLRHAGRPAETVRTLLDFGCGAGRVLPHVAASIPAAAATGCDVDATAITWAARHRPEHDWVLSDFEPPLPFTDAAFDLVYSISVLSHLDDTLQDRWLAELRRVLAPGGIALLSVHGSHAFAAFRSRRVRTSWCDPGAFDRAPLAADEFVFVPYRRSRWNEGELPGVGRGYGLAFHGEAYIRARWSPAYEVVDVLPQAVTAWQDLVVCRA